MFAPQRSRFSTLATLPLLAMLAAIPTLAQAPDNSGNYQWNPVKIGSGGWMRGVAVGDATHVYARADVDGFYRLVNGKFVQTKIAAGFPYSVTNAATNNQPFSIPSAPVAGGAGAIAVDPSNPQNVLVAYSLGYSTDLSSLNLQNSSLGLNVYYSSYSADGTLTFTGANLSLSGDLSTETDGERLAIDPNNGSIAYFGTPGVPFTTDGELYRSTDGGHNWSIVSGGGIYATPSSIVNGGTRYEFSQPRFDKGSGTVNVGGQNVTATIYVTYLTHLDTIDPTYGPGEKNTGGGIIVSHDGGQTWTDISFENAEIVVATVDSLGELLVSDTSNIFKWPRSGSTQTDWVTLTQPPDSSGGGGGIAVDPSDPTCQRIWEIGGGGQLDRSVDGGQTWTPLGVGINGGLNISSTEDIAWLRPSPFRPLGHTISVSGLYFDNQGNLWVAGANDGVLTAKATYPDPSNTNDTAIPTFSSPDGIEEMVAQPIVIPPGGYPVLTFEDESLFTITDPTTYAGANHFAFNSQTQNNPATGAALTLWDNNNGLSSGTGIAYIPNQPSVLVVASGNIETKHPLFQNTEFSSYSLDKGLTWTLFPSIANLNHPCVLYGGEIAISARSGGPGDLTWGQENIVWIPTQADDYYYPNAAGGNGYEGPSARVPAPFYSTDGGATWTQTSSFDSDPNSMPNVPSPCPTLGGGPANITYMGQQWGPWTFSLTQNMLVADPLNPGYFYADLNVGGLWMTKDGGKTWNQLLSNSVDPGFPQHGQMFANPYASGDLWLVDGSNGSDSTGHGLFHYTTQTGTFTKNPNFTYAWTLALGKSGASDGYPAIYIYGQYAGDPNWGIFQSLDHGVTFSRISYYPGGLLDVPNSMAASLDNFGVVYLGFGGNSAYYSTFTGTPPNGSGGGSTLQEPAISPNGAKSASAVSVSIGYPSGATVRYTTDNSTPSDSNGTVYSGPFTVSTNETVKAIAYETGYTDSSVASATFTITGSGSGSGLANGTYTVINAISGLVWDDPGQSQANGAAIDLASATGGPTQQWTFTSTGNGSYEIVNSYSGNALDVPGWTTATNVALDQWAYGTQANQQWVVTASGSGYVITSQYDGLAVDPAANTAGADIQQSTPTGLTGQIWLIGSSETQLGTPTISPNGGSSTSAVSVSIGYPSGATVRYTTDNSTPSETNGTVYSGPFTVSTTETVKAIAYESGYTDSAVASASFTVGGTTLVNGTYTVTNASSGLVWDDPGWANANGTGIDLYASNGGQNQKWVFTALGGGVYEIQNSYTTLALDVPGWTTAAGAALDQWTYGTQSNQQWLLTPSGSGYTITSQSSGLVVDPGANATGANLQQSAATGATSQVWNIN